MKETFFERECRIVHTFTKAANQVLQFEIQKDHLNGIMWHVYKGNTPHAIKNKKKYTAYVLEIQQT